MFCRDWCVTESFYIDMDLTAKIMECQLLHLGCATITLRMLSHDKINKSRNACETIMLGFTLLYVRYTRTVYF